jgi:hypothetical protein
MRKSDVRVLVPPSRADAGDCPVPGQGKSSGVGIYLSAQVECASRIGKTPCAGGYKGEFVVVEYARDRCWGQGPGERAGNTVAVGPGKYVAADIGQVADIEDEFRRSVEVAQLHRISPVDDFGKHVALVQRHTRNDRTGNSAIERHHLPGYRRGGWRHKHCRNAGEEQRNQKSSCWFELNVSIFHSLVDLLFWVLTEVPFPSL